MLEQLQRPPYAPLQPLHDPIVDQAGVQLFLKREDLIHPQISGNKWRKLKYNLLAAYADHQQTLLTFGGAYSNHIFATAAAGQLLGFKTLGLIRGEPHTPLNSTLAFATACGMQLHYLDRQTYRHKHTTEFIAHLHQQFGEFYLLPEGGTNLLAVRGCAELVADIAVPFDTLCCACGTGGTVTGLIVGAPAKTRVLGFPVLKGANFLYAAIQELLLAYNHPIHCEWELQLNYHFGGYAKATPELLAFIAWFYDTHHIALDRVYTGKLLAGIYALIQQGFFQWGEHVVVIHSGGIQKSTPIQSDCT